MTLLLMSLPPGALPPYPPSRYVIVDEFVDVSGTGWARAFFIVNYIIGVAVILNLVVTVVINSFWDEYKQTNEPKNTLRQLHDAAAASAGHHHPPPPRDACDGDGSGGGGTAAVCESVEGVAADVAGSPGRRIGWGWQGVPADEEEAAAAVPTPAVVSSTAADPNADSRRGSRDGSLYSSSSGQQQPQARPLGDEAGMDAERSIARRASRRRLDVSGIT